MINWTITKEKISSEKKKKNIEIITMITRTNRY
jgi:hypothetical protein